MDVESYYRRFLDVQAGLPPLHFARWSKDTIYLGLSHLLGIILSSGLFSETEHIHENARGRNSENPSRVAFR